MIIIPVKFDKEHPYIFDCVEAIHTHMPEQHIVIVDSYSEDMSYIHDLRGVDILEEQNANYGTTAFAMAYTKYQDEDFYYCIYDSLIIQTDLSYLEQWPVTAFRYFKTPPTGWGTDANGENLSTWADEQIMRMTGYHIDPVFHGIVGPMFAASQDVMRNLRMFGIFNVRPQDKYQLCAMERLYGIAIEKMGFNFWSNAPQGEMTDFWAEFPEDKVKKINAARM